MGVTDAEQVAKLKVNLQPYTVQYCLVMREKFGEVRETLVVMRAEHAKPLEGAHKRHGGNNLNHTTEKLDDVDVPHRAPTLGIGWLW